MSASDEVVRHAGLACRAANCCGVLGRSARRIPAASSAASSRTASGPPRSAALTNAEPTITASAKPAISRGLLAGSDPEADAERQVGDRPAAGDQLRRGGRHLVACAGHPHRGRDVEEAAGGRGGQRDPLGRRRRRHEEDRVQPCAARGGQPRPGLVDDQVRGDDAGAAGGRQIRGETVDTVGQRDRHPGVQQPAGVRVRRAGGELHAGQQGGDRRPAGAARRRPRR